MSYHDATRNPRTGIPAGFVFSITLGLSARSETSTVFNRDNLSDRRQLQLYGLALLLVLLPVEFGIGDRILKTVRISGEQWLICIAFAIAMLLIDELIKFFMRRSRQQKEPAG
jgi:Ca2+-transporting ATPase